MFIKIGSLNIHYKLAGRGEPLLLLHGWGCNTEYFANLQKYLAKQFAVYVIDLPGFGLSTPPEKIWGSAEYANLVMQFISVMHINNPVLIGHSLGGKIIIILVARNLVKVKKIVLISSAGVKLPRSIKINFKIGFFKIIKFIASLPIIKNIFGISVELYKRKFGSNDYKDANYWMRSILVKIVNEDVTPLLSPIQVSTLLLWGDQDSITPLKAGQIMQSKIPQAKLKVFSGGGHHLLLDHYDEIVVELDRFLK